MVSLAKVVLVGVLGPTTVGRQSDIGMGLVRRYVNFEVRDVQVWKGPLPQPSQSAYVESSWPINLGIEPLASATPIGARVIVLSEGVDGLLGAVASTDVVGATTCVQSNLLAGGPRSLFIEGVDGKTFVPWELEGPLLVNGSESLDTFEGALTAIRAATR